MASATAGEAAGTRHAAERWSLPARQARSRATRDRILRAAEAVFAARGYEGARLADIAEEAGCSVGAVYFRFKDKEALFHAIADSFAAETRHRLRELVEDCDPGLPDETVTRFVRGTARLFRAHKGLIRAVVERGFVEADALAPLYALRDECAGALERKIAPGTRHIRDLPFRIRVMTQMVYCYLVSALLNLKAPVKIGEPRAIDELVRAMLAYLDLKDRK